MKRNGAVKSYLPIPQTQSDDEESTHLSPGVESADKLAPVHSDLSLGAKSPTEENLKSAKSGDSSDGTDAPLSPLRTFLFVLSLAFCGLSILTFFLLIPCKNESHVGSPNFHIEDISKLKQRSITTNMQVIYNKEGKAALLFGFSGMKDQNSTEYRFSSVDLLQKKEQWNVSFQSQLSHCQCGYFDNASQGQMCVISGDDGLVASISSETGVVQWVSDGNSSSVPAHPPLLVPSCEDQKSRQDILLFSYPGGGHESAKMRLSLLLMASGRMSDFSISVGVCEKNVSPLKMANDVLFYCEDAKESGKVWRLSYASLCNSITKKVDAGFEEIYSLNGTEKFHQLLVVEDGIVLILEAAEGTSVVGLSGRDYTHRWRALLPMLKTPRPAVIGKIVDAKRTNIVIAAVNSSDSQSLIVVLDASNGTEVWSHPYGANGSIDLLDVVTINGKDSLLVKGTFDRQISVLNTEPLKKTASKSRPVRGLGLNEILSGSHRKRKGLLHDQFAFDSFASDEQQFAGNDFEREQVSPYLAMNGLQDEASFLGLSDSMLPMLKEDLGKTWTKVQQNEVYYKLTYPTAVLEKLASMTLYQICSQGSMCYPTAMKSEHAVVKAKNSSFSDELVLASTSALVSKDPPKKEPEIMTLVQKISLEGTYEQPKNCFW